MTTVSVSLEEVDRLRTLRRLRTWLGVVGTSIFPVGVFVRVLRPPEWLFGAFAILWLAAWMVLVVIHSSYRCPACHEPFHLRGRRRNHFTSTCLNCGLWI